MITNLDAVVSIWRRYVHSLYKKAGTVDGFDNLFDSDGLDRQKAEDTLTTGNRVYMNDYYG